MRQRAVCVLLGMTAVSFVLVAAPCAAAAEGELTLEQLRQKRKALAERKRRIIFNNDGCDCLYFPKKEKLTVESFLAKRTSPVVGSQVGAIAYCSISSGFSHFTHATKVGTVLTRQSADYGIQPTKRNVTQDLIDLGTDALRAVVDFGHKHGIEVFWSMRMNDTHDVAHKPEKPYLLYPPLKVEHPDWLVGDHVKRTPYGRWSSVDYGRAEVRDLAFRYIEEVCRSYDVDGVEMDFFRHLCYFKSTAMGGKATDAERDLMTELLRRVRAMTEQVGKKRGRPILTAVRVPDSVGFCRDMGFDIERWLADGLVDILITTCYFKLNPWETTVALAHKHGVQAYPCLSDSRVRGQTRFMRGSVAAFRGRAMNAWAAGADGLHVFNSFNPRSPIWREAGDPEKLRTMDKLYFVTVRDGSPNRFLAKGDRYRTVPILTPSHPRTMAPGRPMKTEIRIGDDVARAVKAGLAPRVTLHLELPRLVRAEQVGASFNGQTLADGKLAKGWVDYPVPASCVKQGVNSVELAVTPEPLRADEWSVELDCSAKPGRPWRRDRGSKRTEEKLVDGSLLIADRGQVSGDYLYYRCPWGADPATESVIEARVKVVAGSSFVIFANGVSGERLGLWPDHVDLFHDRKIRYDMDTTDAFHVYRIVLKGRDLKVYVDGELRIDAKGALKPRRGYPRNELAFGAANSGMMGEAYWKSVKARVTGQCCQDVVVSIGYKSK